LQVNKDEKDPGTFIHFIKTITIKSNQLFCISLTTLFLNKMSTPFVWTAEVFGTDNAQMDEEHAGLFTAIDKLDAERSLAAFESLAGLVVQHFQDEEALGSLSDAHKVSA
jgi:hypothetical protein